MGSVMVKSVVSQWGMVARTGLSDQGPHHDAYEALICVLWYLSIPWLRDWVVESSDTRSCARPTSVHADHDWRTITVLNQRKQQKIV